MVYSTDSFVVLYSHEASVEISFLETCSAQKPGGSAVTTPSQILQCYGRPCSRWRNSFSSVFLLGEGFPQEACQSRLA